MQSTNDRKMALRNNSSDDSLHSFSSDDSLSSSSTDSLRSILTNKSKYCDYPSKQKNRTDGIAFRSNNLQKSKLITQKDYVRTNINRFVLDSTQNKNRKSNDVDNTKRQLAVTIQNRLLPPKPLPRIGPVSKLKTVSAPEIYSSFTNRQSQNKTEEKPSENYPLSKVIGATKGERKKRAKDVIHIEVFMPVVDSERKIIIYPESRTPVIKCYSINEYHLLKSKGRSNINKNNETNLIKAFMKKTNESYATPKGKTVSCQTIGNERYNYNNVLIKSELLQTNLKSTAKTTDLPKLKAKNEIQKFSKDENSIKKCNSIKIPQNHVVQIPERKCWKKDSGALGNVCKGNKDEITNKKTYSNFNYESHQDGNQNFMLTVLNYAENKTGSYCSKAADDIPKQSAYKEMDNANKKRSTREKNARNFEHTLKGPSQKKLMNYKQLLDKITKETEESTLLPLQQLIKSKSDANGWRRNISMTACANRSSSSKNNQKRNLKDQDELNMETWIDRSKYLQSRKQNKQNDRCQQNNWRKG